jgi:phosphoenolpyruvate---glycerone phosphotransferase subunit DhaL
VLAGSELARRWLDLSVHRIERHATRLTELDAAIGDGDHGINLQRGFAAIGERLGTGQAAEQLAASGGELFAMAGRTLVSTVGGAAGPLYGTFFLQLAEELDGADTLHPEPFGRALEASVSAVGRRGRSTTGEKTMLDALVPGAQAWIATVDGSFLARASAAARAADAGRAATAPLVATKGRASYLGERSRGHVDPGAASSALLLEALAEAIAQMGDGEGRSR